MNLDRFANRARARRVNSFRKFIHANNQLTASLLWIIISMIISTARVGVNMLVVRGINLDPNVFGLDIVRQMCLFIRSFNMEATGVCDWLPNYWVTKNEAMELVTRSSELEDVYARMAQMRWDKPLYGRKKDRISWVDIKTEELETNCPNTENINFEKYEESVSLKEKMIEWCN